MLTCPRLPPTLIPFPRAALGFLVFELSLMMASRLMFILFSTDPSFSTTILVAMRTVRGKGMLPKKFCLNESGALLSSLGAGHRKHGLHGFQHLRARDD